MTDGKERIVAAVNACRSDILSGGFRTDIERIAACVSRHLSPYCDNPHVRALLDTLARGSLACNELLELTFSTDPDFILGFFDVAYNPESFLEAASVAEVPVPQNVLSLCPEGNAVPVVIRACTDGFRYPLAVAVFGENYVGARLQEHHKAYYFIDKFVARFKNFTRPAITDMWSPTAFPDILAADDAALMQAAAVWVHMHECHHRRGFLPIPRHLKEKSTRNAAGAEELRVDLVTILTLSGLAVSDPSASVAIQYILAERLIRYPLQSAPEENYDARSSVALFNFLRRHGFVCERGGRLYFPGGHARLRRALSSVAVKMGALEYRLSVSPEINRKTVLSKVLPGLAKNDDIWDRSVPRGAGPARPQ